MTGGCVREGERESDETEGLERAALEAEVDGREGRGVGGTCVRKCLTRGGRLGLRVLGELCPCDEDCRRRPTGEVVISSDQRLLVGSL